MNSNEARALFYQHANAMAYIDVQLPDGTRSIGSAFHVGEGVFITARHVVDGNKIIEIKVTEPVPISTSEFLRTVLGNDMGAMGFDINDDTFVRQYEESSCSATGQVPMFKHWLDPLPISKGPYYLDNPAFDVAVFQVKDIHPSTGVIKLGVHWDDWVVTGFWQLSDAIVLGYPPIPMSNSPVLLAARAEVHTVIIPRHAPSVHFILSAVPRGGFSGGVALSESGEALGVVTSELTHADVPVASGFMAVLSIEPIVACLRSHGLWPAIQEQHHSERVNLVRDRRQSAGLVGTRHGIISSTLANSPDKPE
jgi:hypothetical protein